jgi:hypothetical protein
VGCTVLLAAAVVVLVVGLLAGVVGLGVYVVATRETPRERIVGTWVSTDQPPVGTLEFQRDGTFLARPPNGPVTTARYRLLDDRTLEVEVANPAKAAQKALLQRLPRGDLLPGGNLPDTVKATVTILRLTRRELVLETLDGPRHFSRGNGW